MEKTSTGELAAHNVAAAMFRKPVSLHDAVADLRGAGFSNLAVAFSADAKSRQRDVARNRRLREKFLKGKKHSFAWRMRHGFEADLHRQGVEVLTGKGSEILPRMEAGIIVPRGKSGMPSGVLDSKVDLEETLRSEGVPQFRIDLMNREIGPNGSLLMVEAGDRSNEAQQILERNRGVNCTETATEQPPEGAAEHEGMLEFQVLRETVL